MSSITDQELSTLLKNIQVSLNEVYERDSKWRVNGSWPKGETGCILNPPVTPASVAAFEKKSRKQFPPAYRHFLRLNNGCRHFWLDFDLLGADAPQNSKILADVSHREVEMMEELEDDLGELSAKNIDDWEVEDDCNLYLPKHLVVGTTYAGELLVFDSRKTDEAGEREIVYWTLDYGAWNDQRFEDFYKYLFWVNEQVEDELKKLRKKSPSKKRK